MPRVFIPASLRKYTGSQGEANIEAATVREVIVQLERIFPGISGRLTVAGELKPGLAVAIDSRICAHGLLEKVAPESEIHFVFSVPGG